MSNEHRFRCPADALVVRHPTDGRAVQGVLPRCRNRLELCIPAFGTTLQSLPVPDRHGRLADFAPGCADIAGHETRPPFSRDTIGRFRNRIADQIGRGTGPRIAAGRGCDHNHVLRDMSAAGTLA